MYAKLMVARRNLEGTSSYLRQSEDMLRFDWMVLVGNHWGSKNVGGY